jgi:hypothetical protein
MVAMLRQDFPLAFPGVGDADLEILVSQWLEKATEYGLREEPDLRLYVRLHAILSRDFDVDPQFFWTREILDQHDLTGTDKMDLIHDRLVFWSTEYA